MAWPLSQADSLSPLRTALDAKRAKAATAFQAFEVERERVIASGADPTNLESKSLDKLRRLKAEYDTAALESKQADQSFFTALDSKAPTLLNGESLGRKWVNKLTDFGT